MSGNRDLWYCSVILIIWTVVCCTKAGNHYSLLFFLVFFFFFSIKTHQSEVKKRKKSKKEKRKKVRDLDKNLMDVVKVKMLVWSRVRCNCYLLRNCCRFYFPPIMI